MATVPHTLAPCEPLTTSDHTAETHWQDAVTQVGEQLRAKLRVEVLPDRLHKALALVLAHAVTLHPDGTASVQSGKQTYRLAPDCSCADATHRAELCKHRLAVELHRRALALLDSTALAPASSPTAVAAEAPAGATQPPSAEAPPVATPPAAEDTGQERLPSADRWDVNEAPASCCLRLRVGDIELMYTMRDISDAELTSRVQHLVPWVQDILDQARERQALLDTLRQQREAAQASPAAPAPSALQPTTPPVDLQALLQQAVQQALAVQAAANGQAPSAPPPAPPSTGTAANGNAPSCQAHQVPLELRRNARGAWYSHWLAADARWCRGK